MKILTDAEGNKYEVMGVTTELVSGTTFQDSFYVRKVETRSPAKKWLDENYPKVNPGDPGIHGDGINYCRRAAANAIDKFVAVARAGEHTAYSCCGDKYKAVSLQTLLDWAGVK